MFIETSIPISYELTNLEKLTAYLRVRDADGFNAILLMKHDGVKTGAGSLLVMFNRNVAMMDYFDEKGAYFGSWIESDDTTEYVFYDANLCVGTVEGETSPRIIPEGEAYQAAISFYLNGQLSTGDHPLKLLCEDVR